MSESVFRGGPGDDRFSSSNFGADLQGGSGNDTLLAYNGNSTVSGDAGNDVLYASGNTSFNFQSTLNGGTGDDILTLASSNSVAFGGAEADILTSSGSDNYLDAGSGDDVVTSGGQNNRLLGMDGNDTLTASGEGHILEGGAGDDLLTASGSAALLGGAGNDTAALSDARDAYTFTRVGPAVVQVVNNANISNNYLLRDIENVSFAGGEAVPLNTIIPCYASGTLIATRRGAVPVEHLSIGDEVLTVSGRHGTAAPVRWLGHRRVDLRHHPDPAAVRPYRVRAGALGEGVPARDLFLSPDHCVWLDGLLIPVRELRNSSSITQDTQAEAVTYWHVELEYHDVLLAEGTPAESYLDTGNRKAFSNGGAVTQLHPDFAVDDGRPAARLVPRLEIGDAGRVSALRGQLASRGRSLGPDQVMRRAAS